MAISQMLYWSFVGLIFWMTIPLGLRGLAAQFDSVSALLVAFGLLVTILSLLPAVRSRITNGRLPRGNAIMLAIFLVLVGVLQIPKLFLTADFAPYGTLFELADKLVLLALIAFASAQLIVGATRAGAS